MKITVLGAGSWGIALLDLLVENGHKVVIWEIDGKRAKNLNDSRKIRYFETDVIVDLPKEINITNSLDSVKYSEGVLFAVPSHCMRSTCLLLKGEGISLNGKLIISATKGIENKTFLRMSEVIENVFPGIYDNIAVISGPSHAEEVCRKVLTVVISASQNFDTAEKCRKLFMNDYFKVYIQSDIIGVEIGAALKNVFAIAAGIVDGLKYGDNTKAAVVSRGLKELVKIGVILGGKEQTFYGLSGLGDLMVTCFSRHSRNRSVGQYIGEGKSFEEAQKSLGMIVAEGIKNTASAYELGKKFNIELPIVNEIYHVLFKNKNPIDAVNDSMKMDARQE
ncbi:MAG: NAD(P)-dependent glycerol-3-phosphate dehydrogenase [Endomicrobium sp.]|jgi:glycerol-3-phosphate dehydrogenase (NAD(P)+)|nr:NAD(P)-dependent glycerol-3-phosphate dehydrogenase [Endomicrobium sp.]